jgi:hypothetical protein
MSSFCDNGNGTSGFIKVGEFIDQLISNQIQEIQRSLRNEPN